RWLRPWPLAGLFLVPLIVMLGNWTNAWHDLYYTREWLEPSGAYTVLAKERGPLYMINFAYAYLVILLALFYIVRALRCDDFAVRPQLALLLAAYLLPFVMNIPYTFRLMPHRHINLTLLGFCGSSILLCIGIFRFQLLSPLPLDMSERNQLLLRHAHALLYTIKPDGAFTYVTPNWPSLLGHSPDEVIGKHFSEFVLPEDHAVCRAFLDKVVSTGELQTDVEYRALHKKGHIVWHTSSIIPVTDNKGRLLAYVGAAHDITRMKHAQEELSRVNKRLFTLIESRETELREAISETLTAAESEARRIGHDIHDGLCQDLVGLCRLTESIDFRSDEISEASQRALALVREQAVRMAGSARAFSHDLTLHELEIQTLPEALDTLARRTDRLFQTETELNLPDQFAALTHEQSMHIYRIIREAIANAVKHAQAKRLWIELVREPEQLVVSISNDGRPLPKPVDLVDGLGMKQMRMRARLLGGRFTLRQKKQALTVAELILPLQGDSEC
ncbi:MAG: PAS domain S-box protein, partial [Spartobacteria bacterium]|nr:PAS domain S-box protein [Spartobacteria bacterium]